MNILAKTKDLSHEEWLKYRTQGIGGSDVSILAGINPFKSVHQLWLEKTGQVEPEEGDTEYVFTVDNDEAMKCGFTVAQVYQELASALATEKDSTKITVEDQQYNVKIVDERDELDTQNLSDYEFETTKMNDKGKEVTKTYKLSKFAKITKGKSVERLARRNLEK